MALSASLVEALLALARQGLSADIHRKTLLHVADAAAIAIAARETSPVAAMVRDAFGASATSATARAFVLSAYVHILDFDDIHDVARVHPTSVTLPAAIAAADRACTGAEVVQAVALGNELLCRLGSILRPVGRGPGADWFLTQLFGYFAAAFSAGLVLRLDARQLASALGLAYMQAAGGKEAGFGVGSNARAIYPAFAAQGGVQAALLARAGLVGPAGAFDGDAGLFPLYFGAQPTPGQREALLDATRWEWSATEVKPWPSCRHSHPYVHAALRLRAQLDPASIERVDVRVNRSSGRLCSPIEERRAPRTLQDAKYSIPFMVAFALCHGEVSLANLTEAALADASVLALAQRVFTEESAPDEAGLPRARITVKTGGAAAGSMSFDEPFSFVATPESVRSKFRSCFRHAALPAAQAEAAWEAIAGLASSGAASLLDLLAVEPARRA